MSYRNYKIIPTVIPGAGIGDAIMGLAKPAQDAIYARAEAVEEENKRIAEQQLEDETAELALIGDQNTRSDEENAALDEAKKGFKLIEGTKFNDSLTTQFEAERLADEKEQTFEIKKQSQQTIADQKRFRQGIMDNLGGLGALKESSVEAAGQDKNYRDDTARAVDQWGQGLGTWSIESGADLDQYIINQKGEKYKLPMDQIRSGDYDPFVSN